MLRERREKIGGGASGQDLRGAGRFNLLIAGSVFFLASPKGLPKRDSSRRDRKGSTTDSLVCLKESL